MRRIGLGAGILAALLAGLVLLSACDKAEAPESDLTPAASAVATQAGPAITVDKPQPGDTVTVPVTVSGMATVFEGTVNLAVKDANGQTLCETFTTASEGAPGSGSFQAQLFFPPPASPSNMTIEAFDVSAKDGSVQDLVSVPVTVSSEQPAIVVTAPVCGDQVTSPVLVEGTASVFEAALSIVVKDSLGQVLARADVLASEGAPARGTFSQELTFSLTGGAEAGTIEAFNTSAKDGSVQNLFSVPVILSP
jgi:hypothetical protein